MISKQNLYLQVYSFFVGNTSVDYTLHQEESMVEYIVVRLSVCWLSGSKESECCSFQAVPVCRIANL